LKPIYIMPNIDFQNLRLKLDDALTYGGPDAARRIAVRAFLAARTEENVGEMMYFSAQVAMLEENYEEAVRCLHQAIAMNSRDGAAYNDLALCQVELGHLEDALVLFDQGIAVEPGFATIHHNKGWFLNKTGHYQAAIACLRKALILEPDRAVTFENLADVYTNLDQIPQAVAACQRAIALLKPECADIKQQLKKKLRGLLLGNP
jgi:tetratricopeptide (TPR) repeat protein